MAPMRMRASGPPSQGQPSRIDRPGSLIGAAFVSVTACWLTAFTDAAAWEITPRGSLGQIWTDNLRLESEDLQDSEWITEFRPGFSLIRSGPRAEIQFDYDLQALWYARESDRTGTNHQAYGSADLVLVPQSLFMDASVTYAQQMIEPGGLIDYTNLYETGNRTDSFVYSASPFHVRQWGSWGESLVRYRYQGVNYRNTDDGADQPPNSDTHSALAFIGSPIASPGLNWRLTGSYVQTGYDVELDTETDFKYAVVEMHLGVPITRYTRVTADVGAESDVEEDPSSGSLDADFWFLGFEWEPNNRHRLSGRGGERFYGSAWELSWMRRGSRGEVSLDYSEEPTTVSGVLGDDAIFQPGDRPSGAPGLGAGAFLLKSLNANARYDLSKTTVRSQIYAKRYLYLDGSGGRERYYGGSLTFDRQIATRTYLGLSVFIEERSVAVDSGDDLLGEVGVSLNRDLSRRLIGSIEVRHRFLNSDDSEDYRANSIAVRVRTPL